MKIQNKLSEIGQISVSFWTLHKKTHLTFFNHIIVSQLIKFVAHF
jgi:hypothetical protein